MDKSHQQQSSSELILGEEITGRVPDLSSTRPDAGGSRLPAAHNGHHSSEAATFNGSGPPAQTDSKSKPFEEPASSSSSTLASSASVGRVPEKEEEWSPEKDDTALGKEVAADNDKDEQIDGEVGDEEEEEEDEHLYSEDSDVEDVDSETDYENEAVVQYQAAVDAGLVDEERQCWVCFASDEDDPTATWVHPCRCSGTTKWVHHVCIQRWVDEKQKGNTTAGVSCPQCGTAYIIKFPSSGPIMRVVDAADLLVGRLCPYVAGGIGVGSLYWTCVTFGAVTVMQVAGHDEGLLLMESTDPLVLLITLPLVPVGLMIGKMVRWQEPIIRVLREYLPRVPLARYLLPAFGRDLDREPSGAAAALPASSEPVSITRTICGALFFPTIATFLGSALYQQTKSPLKRAALGGLTFVLVKGILKIYHKQHLYVRQCKRVILDYP